MLFPPDIDGVYENVSHVMMYLWANDAYLQSVIPASDDEAVNRFHPYGVNHITDDQLLSGGPAYVVVDDLSSGQALRGRVQHSSWPHRVRIYAHDSDGALLAQRLRELFIGLLMSGARQPTHCGNICGVTVTGKRLGQTRSHYFSQFTLQPTVKG